jgi:hypothetical protein
MKGKDLIKKIKELGIEKEIVCSQDFMKTELQDVKIENNKIVLR